MEILVISGLSGAGKSCAASCLEDIGYYTVDNMPAAIIPKFAEFSAESDGRYDRVALVNDIRGGVDSFQELLEVIDRLREGGTVCRLLYLEADTQSIIKRYKETRRRHPLMESGATIEDAVKRETELLRPLRERADFVIDTTQLSAAKLRGELYRLFAEKGQQSRMSINVVSFGYKYGVPLEADLVFDVRFMPNPYYVPELRYQTGMNDDVYNYVFSFPQTKEFLSKLEQMLAFLLPLYQEEGKAVLVVAVGCTGGRHRSVSIARAVTEYLNKLGYAALREPPRYHTRLKGERPCPFPPTPRRSCAACRSRGAAARAPKPTAYCSTRAASPRPRCASSPRARTLPRGCQSSSRRRSAFASTRRRAAAKAFSASRTGRSSPSF